MTTERSETDGREGEDRPGTDRGSEAGSAADESEREDPRETDGKSRRRRRRKRRPRSSQAGRSDAAEPESRSARDEEVTLVPRGIRVDELMPAASGAADGQKANARSGGPKPKTRSSNGRKKRRAAGSGRG